MFCTICGKQQPDKQRPTRAEAGFFASSGSTDQAECKMRSIRLGGGQTGPFKSNAAQLVTRWACSREHVH